MAAARALLRRARGRGRGALARGPRRARQDLQLGVRKVRQAEGGLPVHVRLGGGQRRRGQRLSAASGRRGLSKVRHAKAEADKVLARCARKAGGGRMGAGCGLARGAVHMTRGYERWLRRKGQRDNNTDTEDNTWTSEHA